MKISKSILIIFFVTLTHADDFSQVNKGAPEIMNNFSSVSTLREINHNYPIDNYENKLIYIDTRNIKEYKEERNYSYYLISVFGNNIEDKGIIYIPEKNNIKVSKKILNSVIPEHNYSYNDGPFIVGHTDISTIITDNVGIEKNKNLIINLNGVSEKCLSNFLQDIEQALVRNKINDEETRSRWKVNKIYCEAPTFFDEEYSKKIEKLFSFIRSLT